MFEFNKFICFNRNIILNDNRFCLSIIIDSNHYAMLLFRFLLILINVCLFVIYYFILFVICITITKIHWLLRIVTKVFHFLITVRSFIFTHDKWVLCRQLINYTILCHAEFFMYVMIKES